MAYLQKNRSIDEQMRQLVPKKVSADDKLVDYVVFLLDRFLNVLQNLHGKELRDTVNALEVRWVEYRIIDDPCIGCEEAQ